MGAYAWQFENKSYAWEAEGAEVFPIVQFSSHGGLSPAKRLYSECVLAKEPGSNGSENGGHGRLARGLAGAAEQAMWAAAVRLD